jgi:hypothetical protein
MDACLSNPRLRESDIFLFLDGPIAMATISGLRATLGGSRDSIKTGYSQESKDPSVAHRISSYAADK